ncbi:thioesterase II family protein [Clostridium butyricum]
MILFCLPYAGGSESVYYNWSNHMDEIELYPIELKGRGKRSDEEYYKNIKEAVDDIYTAIKDKVCQEDYAIYGHSMGSLLAYELYYKICDMNHKKPKHIFFSGNKAPNIAKEREISYKMPDSLFMQKIMELGGTPKKLLEDKEVLEFFLPILKNDIKIIEEYKYEERNEKISCDISKLNGEDDNITQDEILEWRNHTSKNCNIYNFEGDHFFINNNLEEITGLIKATLSNNVAYNSVLKV